jgi:hypothetical protein
MSRLGRPPKALADRCAHVLTVRCTQAEIDRIRVASQVDGRSVSGFVRHAVLGLVELLEDDPSLASGTTAGTKQRIPGQS